MLCCIKNNVHGKNFAYIVLQICERKKKQPLIELGQQNFTYLCIKFIEIYCFYVLLMQNHVIVQHQRSFINCRILISHINVSWFILHI
jgi:hypothetical protein